MLHEIQVGIFIGVVLEVWHDIKILLGKKHQLTNASFCNKSKGTSTPLYPKGLCIGTQVYGTDSNVHLPEIFLALF